MYDPTNKILTKEGGLSIDEVRRCLSASTGDLAALCTHGNINKWSKHKPVALAKLLELSAADFRLANYGISIPSTGYSDLSSMVNAVSSGGLQWTYVRPSGGIGVSPFRLLDFDCYNHLARTPIYSIGNSASICDGSAVNLGMAFGRILPGQTMEISLGDLRPSGQSVSSTFDEMYFGICFYDNATHSRAYASTAMEKYKDMIGDTISEIGVIVNGVSTPSYGTRKYIAFPFFSTVPFQAWTSDFSGTMFPVPDVSAYHDFTYQSAYTYGGVVGYYLEDSHNPLNYQFSVNSNQYSTVNVTIDILDSSGQVYQTLFSETVALSNNAYRSEVLSRMDGLLWDNAAQIRITIYRSGIGTVSTSSSSIIRGADPLDPPYV